MLRCVCVCVYTHVWVGGGGGRLLRFPCFANKRCGLWYARQFDGTAYFKSTDGHYGTWNFSLSRLNYHTAVATAEHGGLLLVDSTRKGKVYPDRYSWIGLRLKPPQGLQLLRWAHVRVFGSSGGGSLRAAE